MRLLRGRGLRDTTAQMPAVPAGMRIYAVGDIHGCDALLDALHAIVAADMQSAAGRGLRSVLVYLGDYLDRGPDSRAVIDRLLAPAPGDAERYFLRGNHEAAFLDFLADPDARADWLSFGGVETARSYGAALASSGDWRRRLAKDLASLVPAAHFAFLHGLRSHLVLGDYLFVHAGLEPGRPVESQGDETLLWIREPFLSSRRWHGHMVVHGHSVVASPEVLPNRIAIDTGAYMTGSLSCVVLEGTERRFLSASAA